MSKVEATLPRNVTLISCTAMLVELRAAYSEPVLFGCLVIISLILMLIIVSFIRRLSSIVKITIVIPFAILQVR